MAGIFSIAADFPFLDTLVAGLAVRARGDPLVLARYTVLLPTRRAARALREAFLRAGGGRAMLLPRMVPVGDLDADELAFLADEAESGPQGFDIPPAVPELKRRLMLARLVLAWSRADGRFPLSAGQAARLAAELARFLDEVQAEGSDFSRLVSLVPADYAEHWQNVLRFLEIVTEAWPKALAEIQCLDPAERRNQLLAAQREAWNRATPRHPVIAAGITGGIPEVVELLTLVATLGEGAVVLPGLDRDADAETWEQIRLDPTHPQHLMARFLARLDLQPGEVRDWVEGPKPSPRARLIAEVLRPAEGSHRWRHITGIDDSALAGLARLDCPGPQEEALAVALLLRQRLEQPGATAALITPDRALARRVAAELKRWGIEIDDSAGLPLNKTPPGVFLRLLLALVAEDFAPLPLLAALKHPLAACGLAPEAFRALVRRLEIATLRGPRPKPGIAGLRAVLPAGDAELADCLARIDAALKPLATALASREIKLVDLVAAHVAAAEALAAGDAEPGAARLWREPAGEALALFANQLLQASSDFPALAGTDYPALFESLLAGPVVRPVFGRHPRLFIWGLLEARLQHADLIVLGGLNEGVWPPSSESDPWLSRPMRRDFGLAPPERRIGIAALDFAAALGAREVVLTRATRIEGAPTSPSRWLLRLETVLRALSLEGRLKARAPLDWQLLIDEPFRRIAIDPPAPRPPVKTRPRRLSVTEIETWMRDPYAIYAKHVLRLTALDPIDADPGAAERGQIIHAALAAFVRAFPQDLPQHPAERLIALGREAFGSALARPGVWAFWWPRFERIAHWVAALEGERRGAIAEIGAEIKGRLLLDGPEGKFELVGRADRIERRREGSVAIIDYKTGAVPTGPDVALGLSPQLPLEAAMLAAGGCDGIAAAEVVELAYWRLTGADPPGEVKTLGSDGEALRGLIAEARDGLKHLIATFDDPVTPYRSTPWPEKAPRYSDYAHLARIKEWQLASEGE